VVAFARSYGLPLSLEWLIQDENSDSRGSGGNGSRDGGQGGGQRRQRGSGQFIFKVARRAL
jgi:hypothetical protein